MKKILSIFVLTFFLAGCQDKDLNNYVFPEYEVGDFVLLDELKNTVLDYGSIASGEDPDYTFVLTKVAGNAQSWTLHASLNGVNDQEEGAAIITVDIAALEYYEKEEVTIKASDIAASWGEDLSVFSAGDQIQFEAKITGADGEVITSDNLDGDLYGNAGPKQGLHWSTFLSCAFDANEAAGTYEVVEDGWADWSPGDEIEVEANADGTGVIVKGMYSKWRNDSRGPYDVEILVNASTGVATVAKQPAWEYFWYAGAEVYGTGSVQGSGFVFSCSGIITVTLNHTVAAGSFGSYNLVLQKP